MADQKPFLNLQHFMDFIFFPLSRVLNEKKPSRRETVSPTRAEKVTAFRALHYGPGACVIPNLWDIGSACILARLGFQALATTSSGMAFSLGLPDGAVNPKLVLEHCKTMVTATSLPLSADLEKGFGDSPRDVYKTILAAAEIGLAGGSIEDHTGNPAQPIFEKTLAVERIAAAVEA
jgi:2-methylisocitrate lyase-like PEP mutase family enzyme